MPGRRQTGRRRQQMGEDGAGGADEVPLGGEVAVPRRRAEPPVLHRPEEGVMHEARQRRAVAGAQGGRGAHAGTPASARQARISSRVGKADKVPRRETVRAAAAAAPRRAGPAGAPVRRAAT